MGGRTEKQIGVTMKPQAKKSGLTWTQSYSLIFFVYVYSIKKNMIMYLQHMYFLKKCTLAYCQSMYCVLVKLNSISI